MATRPSVAALVLNYNGCEVTLESLESLVELDYSELEIVVIDNGSTDDSWDRIADAFPDLLQLQVAENQGISWGLNHGLQWALEHGFDYVLILNNDIEVAPTMLSEMIAVAESDESIGCVGPKSYYYFDRQRLWSVGGRLRFRHAITRERGDGEIDRGQYERDLEVDYVNGCAMLVRRAALEQAGYWDPSYFLGIEDADFCVRVKRAGYSCWYAHRALLWHKISHSLGVYTPFRTFHTGRSSAIFVRKFARPHQWLLTLLFLAAAIPAAFVRELPRGNQGAALAKLRGFVAGLRADLQPIPARYPEPKLRRGAEHDELAERRRR